MRWELVGLSALLLWGARPAVAQEALFHGFAQVNYAVRATGAATDFLLGDERVQLELSRASGSGGVGFASRIDLYRDAVDAEGGVDIREVYLTLATGRFDLRLGRQIVTWGVGDLTFVGDVFPKDWTALLSGRPLQYLKVGSDAVNLNLYLDFLSVQAILIPFFEPDRLPQGRRLFAFNPFPNVPIQTFKPQPRVENTELAIRLYRYIGAFDASVYAYRGFWRSPPGMRFDGERVVRFYPKLLVYAASLQGGILNGVLSLEGGLYDSRQDREGADPAVENRQARVLAGYQRAFGDNLTVGLQYYGERMLNHGAYRKNLPPNFPAREAFRHSATLRITQFFKYQTVRFSLFAWASPNEEDFYFNPEIRYNLSDEVWIATGGNFFDGAQGHTFFGQFDRNDNLYAAVRYGF